MQLFSYRTHRYPLGRWRNCGEYFDEKQVKLKIIQKKEREVMLKNQIDPYILKTGKDNLYRVSFSHK